ncbi:glyoxylase-like metal-dependent hydrolase (beta-lactamase superfamily II) [Nonlabens dokdonensis]|jgi:glyoxylase-like metal-dependent hydrolase (beta-lactamase superfamily II)/rhodanese-related sulfurtransferase|uniref:Metallo beta lactamase superfamily protein n=2 Tax=Nonlabens dokdonensis TaxID=328515 RepID=L7W5H2_NONDD|nr:MBL fold metallo-hydrolase [Nonlabens dokdonensis]AGC75432.1 metallo beta lactamase superfamily protein [Nonlabens dokdonensis DSW-6]PZX43130.1 glyoxylase-like metal-dependent hydrolase (beta-lactamase superfamily II) [Nonlabens dokdonensis]
MILEQYYTKCLAQGTYYIASNGEAAIIDPLREVQPYIDRAAKDGVQIKYIFLTHFHADFVSGHVDLADKTGATIVIGPNAVTSYAFAKAEHLQTFSIGDISLQLLHTPGHTMESSCYLLRDEDGKEQAIFTGDTLFIGDVGRPDLAVKSDLSTEDLAGHLFDSLRNEIMPLPDHITVYPAHGAGSACGKNMSKETSDSLGNQKKTNYALNPDLTKEDFIKEVTTGIAPPPAYFPKNVWMNKGVNSSIDEVISRGNTPLKLEAFKALANDPEFLVLDVRSPQEYTAGAVPGSLFIGLDGQFAPWVGSLIQDIDQKIILVTPQGREEETVTRLARVGYDNAQGYLTGGFETWANTGSEVSTIKNVTAQEFIDGLEDESIENPIDARKPGEYEAGHLCSVPLHTLDSVHEEVNQLDADKTYHIYCGGGYRSVIYASIAQANGINNVVNVEGGYAAIKKTDLKNQKIVATSSCSL